MKNKVLIIVMAAVLIAVCVFRCYSINKELEVYATEELNYSVGEEIPFENDFFFNSGDNSNGYSVTVLDKNYMNTDEFKEKYGSDDEDLLGFSDYVYLVRINVKNISNNKGEAKGVDISRFLLQESSFICYPDKEAFFLANDFDSPGFSLSPGKEREFIIPFGIISEYNDIERLENKDTKLVISLYPHKKMVSLNQR